ncbi:PcfJ domain-containing protein [Anaeromyxobacter oryzae]|nr:PcfJ domain-containing protein [Anaeromyxobacter oryzae]
MRWTDPWQLDLETTARFEGAGEAVVVVHRWRGKRLELLVERWDEARHLVVHVGRPAELSVRRLGPHPGASRAPRPDVAEFMPQIWPVGHRSGWGGVFERLAKFATDCITYGQATPALRRSASSCTGHLRAIARALHARLDRDALCAALPFAPELRWWIYSAALNDESGRVAQLAHVCPGALLLSFQHAFAHAFAGRLMDGLASRSIVWNALAGMPLRRLIRRSVRCWGRLPFPSPFRDPDLPREDLGATWRERVEARDRQELLVRRAGPLVSCTDLTRPALPSFAPEDIPHAPDRNARWYRVSAFACMALARASHLAPGARDALSRFVSRHALLIDGHVRRSANSPGMDGFGVLHLVNRLAAYCDATGRRPSPGCDPLTFLEDASIWWQATHAQQHPFPRLPFVPPEPGLEIEPIRTATALYEEGRDMHHCAATLLPNAVRGEQFFYAARVGAERLTLSIEPGRAGGFKIADLRGFANRPPSADARRVVEQWVVRLWQLQAGTA